MAGFGVATDPWAFADTYINLISSTPGAKTGSAAQCPDSNGDVIDETEYDTGATHEAEYEVLPGGSASFKDTSVDFRLGKVISSKVITGIVVSRNNTGGRLNVKISGENCPQADSAVAKFTPVFADTTATAAYLTGGLNALVMGIVVSAGRVVASTVTASVQVAKGLDSGGAQVFKGVYNGRMEASNDLVSSDTAPAAAADTTNSWVLTASNSKGETNTGYPTATISAYRNMTRDT